MDVALDIDPNDRPRFNTREAAEILNLDYFALLRRCRAGTIGCYQYANRYRFSVNQLREYIEAAERPVQTYDRKVREIVEQYPEAPE